MHGRQNPATTNGGSGVADDLQVACALLLNCRCITSPVADKLAVLRIAAACVVNAEEQTSR